MAQIPRPRHRNDFEIALICALRIEHDAVEALLDENYETDGFSYGKAPGDHNAYTLGRIGNHHVVLVQMPGMGKAYAAGVASSLRTSFDGIKLGILVGICGGVPNTAEGAEILLGDVVISTTVVQIDIGRQYPHKFARKDALEENLGRPNSEVRAFLEKVSGQLSRQRVKDRTAYYSEELCKEKRLEYPGVENDKLYQPQYRHKHQLQSSCPVCAQCRTIDNEVCEIALNSSCMDLVCDDRYLVPRNRIIKARGLSSDGIPTTGTKGTRKPSIHFGRVTSGDTVMKCGRHRDDIAEREKVIAFEMEGAGMWECLPTVVIKSVCDYADSHKSKKWQGYAAVTAAACTKAFLEEWRTTDRQDASADCPTVQDYLPEIFNKLPLALDAAFNSRYNDHNPICLENTRVEILQEMELWSLNPDGEFIYWLSGSAGTGKSTIARTVATTLEKAKRLGASFFFSRGGGDIGKASKFFTTLAFQLSKVFPPLRNHIYEAMRKHPDIAEKGLRSQWDHLILQPLSKIKVDPARLPLVLVVDALDECEGDEDVQQILQLFAEAQTLGPVQLRILVTSRPEPLIQRGFRNIPSLYRRDLILNQIHRGLIDRDISIFFQHNLGLLRDTWNDLPLGWPDRDIIHLLVSRAHGLFIYAATICRFLERNEILWPPDDLLQLILANSLQDTSGVIALQDSHTMELDDIYTQVLRHCLQKISNKGNKPSVAAFIRECVGSIVILYDPLSVVAMAKLINIDERLLQRMLNQLRSVLDVPEHRESPVQLYHPSFCDFYLDKLRCSDLQFWVDEKQAHRTLANRCIQLMSSSLKQGICGVGAHGIFVTDIDNSQVQQHLPPEVQYACLYWIQHLQKSGAQLYNNNQVHQFLKEHFLHWLEALGWMRKVSEGIRAIASLESIASDCPDLYAFVHDMKRFTLYSRLGIEQTPLQVYCSALIFAPVMSIVKKQFIDWVPRWMQRLPRVENNWNALLQTLEGHLNWVTAVAFSPDGKVLASASYDKTVKLWDAGTGAMQQTLKGHSSRVNAVAFSPDGMVLASASEGRTIKLWDAGTGAVQQTLKGHSRGVTAVAFSPDGKVLASASWDRTVKLWDAGTGAVQQTLEGHSNWVTAVAFSPDGKVLASASYDKTVKLWDAGTGAVQQTLKGHSSRVNAVAFSPDGKVLASTSDDLTVKLWDSSTGAMQQTLEGHSSEVRAVAFSPDGMVLASASDDKTVMLWDTGTGAVQRTLKGHSNGVNAVAFSPDSKVLASASHDGTVKLWDVGTGAAQQTLEGHSNWVSAVAFSPDGKVLASASHDGTVKLWDTGTGAVQRTLKGHSNGVNAVAFSPDSKVLASASHDGTVKLWDAGTGAAQQTLEGHSNWISAVAFSPDGKVLASASHDGTVKLWDAGTGAVQQTLKGHLNRVVVVAFSPDSKVLASASHDRTARLWDVGTGAAQQTLEGHSNLVNAVAFSPDGKVLASASYDRTVKLWDAGTGAVQQTLKANAAIQTMSFSDDGTFVETNRGILHSISLPPGGRLPRRGLSRGIFVKQQWVTYEMENVLWLPSEYRPVCTAVHGSVVAIGHLSGYVSILEFAF